MNRSTALIAVALSWGIASSSPAQDAARDQLRHLQKKRPFGVLWVEAVPNLKRLLDRAWPKEIVKKCKDAGLKAVAIGVNTTSGEWLIPAKVAPTAVEWGGQSLLPPYDYLQAVIDAAKPEGIEVHAVVKIFCGGDKKLKRGILYQSHPEWATTVLDAVETQELLLRPTIEFTDGKVVSAEIAYLNPYLPLVANFGVDIVDDVLEKHPALDGVVLENVACDGIFTDFSETARKLFTPWLEKVSPKKLKNWPKDVMEVRRLGEDRKVQQGTYYREWIQWRAMRMREWVYRVKEMVRRKRPDLIFAVSVPAGYGRVETDGANWGHDGYSPSTAWAAKSFNTTGYAQYADYLTVDVTAPVVEGPADSVDARLKETVAAACDNRSEFYPGINVAAFAGKPADLGAALLKALNSGQGVRIGDLAAVEETGAWRTLAQVFAGNVNAFPEAK